MTEVARLTAVLDANTGGLTRGLAVAEAQMARTRASMGLMDAANVGAGGRLSRLGSIAGVAGIGIAGVGIAAGVAIGVGVAKGAQSMMALDTQMSKVKAVTGATEAQMRQFRDAALEAGTTSKFSAIEAAEAQVELGKAGMSSAQIMGGGFQAALTLAAAGEMSLADAASTTSNIMGAFNLKASDAAHVSDVLASAANSTTADVSDFAMAMTMGGGAAKLMGLSLDQSVVYLEALAKIGVKGSDAGTSLKSALVQIANPTKQAADAAKQYGLSFTDANGKMKDAATISAMLRSKTGDLTNQQRLALFSTIAGTDGMRVLASLYASTPGALNKYGNALKDHGTAAKQAETMNQNLGAALSRLGNTWEVISIQLADVLKPALTAIVSGVTDLLTAFANSGALTSFANYIGIASRAISGLFGGSGGAAGASQALGTVKNAFTSFSMAAEKIGAAVLPVLQDAFQTLGPPIRNLISALAPLIARLVTLQISIMGGIYRVLADVLPPVIRALAPIFHVVFQGIAAAVNMIAALLRGDFGEAFAAAKRLAILQFVTLPQKIGELLGKVGTIALTKAKELGTNMVSGIVEGLQSLGSAVTDALVELVGNPIDVAKQILGIASPSRVTRDEIGKPIAQGIIIGFLNESASLPEKMSGRLRAALERSKDVLNRYRGQFQSAFGDMSSRVLRAFDAKTDVRIAGIRERGAALTPAEQALQALQAQHDADQRSKDMADARSALAAAQAEGDAGKIRDAQARISDLQYQDRIAALQKQADAERTQRDKQTEIEVREEQSRRDERRVRLEKDLEWLQGYMERRNISVKKKAQKLHAVLNASDVRDAIRDSGTMLGTAFADALANTEGDVLAAAKRVANKLRRILELHSPAKEGPLSTLDRWWQPMAATLASGVDANAVGAVAAGISAPGGAPGAGVVIHVEVHGTVTSERELVDTIRNALLKTGQRNGSIFGAYA